MLDDSFAPPSTIVSANDIIDEFFRTEFLTRISDLGDRLPSSLAGYRLGEDGPDLFLVLNDSLELKSHQTVFGLFSRFFEDLFIEVGKGQREHLQYSFAFPFPGVLVALIDLFYLMSNAEFPFNAFFVDMSIGSPFCYVLMLSILCYLDVPCLIPRVRASLHDHWPTSCLVDGLDSIRDFFLTEIKPKLQPSNTSLCSKVAFARMCTMMDDVFVYWDAPPSIPPFVNPFTRSARRHPTSLVDEPPPPVGQTPSAVRYDPVRNLSSFFAHCHDVPNWDQGSFPGPGYDNSLFRELGLHRLSIQWWYSFFFHWVCGAEKDERLRVVAGSPGIGKSIFGLYFMGRLIAANLDSFCGHNYFAVSWKDTSDSRRWARVTLKGVVTPITLAEFTNDGENRVFRLLDSYSYRMSNSCWPCVCILSPSEFISWKSPPLILYAPSLTLEDLDTLEGVSTRYRLRDGDRDDPQFPFSKTGSIESRMRIAGGNLRLLYGLATIDGLKKYFAEGITALNFYEKPIQYFNSGVPGDGAYYLRLFSCLSIPPFTDPGELTFVSPWVEELVKNKSYRVRSEEDTRHILSVESWIGRILGFHLYKGSAYGLSFEALCHSMIGHSSELSDFHFELVHWKALLCPHPGGYQIKQIVITHVGEGYDIRGELEDIPRFFDHSWYWHPLNQSFEGISGVYFDQPTNMLYLLQMTTNPGHDPVSLSAIWGFVQEAVDFGINMRFRFVTLVDTVEKLWAILQKAEGMIISGDPGSGLSQYVGMVRPGPANTSCPRQTLRQLFNGPIRPLGRALGDDGHRRVLGPRR
jgi:hypothetical protein